MIRNIEGYWEQREVVDEIKESYTRAFSGEAAFTTQAIDAPAQAREWACRNYTLLTVLPPPDSMKRHDNSFVLLGGVLLKSSGILSSTNSSLMLWDLI